MQQHRYKMTVEHIEDKNGHSINEKPMVFNMASHDDIAEILSKMQNSFDENTNMRLIVGLKLLGEVILENKNQPFFNQLDPHFREIMKVVKGKK